MAKGSIPVAGPGPGEGVTPIQVALRVVLPCSPPTHTLAWRVVSSPSPRWQFAYVSYRYIALLFICNVHCVIFVMCIASNHASFSACLQELPLTFNT